MAADHTGQPLHFWARLCPLMHGGRWCMAPSSSSSWDFALALVLALCPSPERRQNVKFMDGGFDLFRMVVGLSQTGTWTKSLNETDDSCIIFTTAVSTSTSSARGGTASWGTASGH